MSCLTVSWMALMPRSASPLQVTRMPQLPMPSMSTLQLQLISLFARQQEQYLPPPHHQLQAQCRGAPFATSVGGMVISQGIVGLAGDQGQGQGPLWGRVFSESWGLSRPQDTQIGSLARGSQGVGGPEARWSLVEGIRRHSNGPIAQARLQVRGTWIPLAVLVDGGCVDEAALMNRQFAQNHHIHLCPRIPPTSIRLGDGTTSVQGGSHMTLCHCCLAWVGSRTTLPLE